MKIISNNERPDKSSKYIKAFHEALKRIAGVTKENKSKDELTAYIFVFEQVLCRLKVMEKSYKFTHLKSIDNKERVHGI